MFVSARRIRGLSEEESEKNAREALELVGFPEKYYKQSPFELSGGQKRRVAIAGVLAMKRKCLFWMSRRRDLIRKGETRFLTRLQNCIKRQG